MQFRTSLKFLQKKRNIVTLGLTALLLLSVPLTIMIAGQQQNTHSKANAATTLSFTPTSDSTTPIQANVGDIITLNLQANPGTNAITYIKYSLTYDPTKLQPVSPNPFTLNTAVFESQNGPVITALSITPVSASSGTLTSSDSGTINSSDSATNRDVVVPTDTSTPTPSSDSNIACPDHVVACSDGSSIADKQVGSTCENIRTCPNGSTISTDSCTDNVCSDQSPTDGVTPTNATPTDVNVTSSESATPTETIITTPIPTDTATSNTSETTTIPTNTNTAVLVGSVSVGSDPTKAVTTTASVGTFQFQAVGSTNGTPTTISFSDDTTVRSAGTNDQATENVLSSTTPATIMIGGSASPSGTLLDMNVLLHGIGNSGDNPNPNGNSLSNKNPLHTQRNVTVEVYDSNNQLVSTASAPLALLYDPNQGSFVGKVPLDPNLPEGMYTLKVKSDMYLKKRLQTIQHIVPLQDNSVPQFDLIAGDVNNDNALNIIDYNALLDCGYGAVDPLPMSDPQAPYNSQACQSHTPTTNVDLDDNGFINSADYNLFLRELSVQNGD